MATELCLDYPSREAFEADYRENLRKGRAFVNGAPALAERSACRVRVAYPGIAGTSVDAEVVWVKRDAPGEGVGVELGEAAREALRLIIEAPPVPVAESASVAEPEEDDASEDAPGRAKTLHERVRGLSLRERETMARQGSLPERIALERAFGSSVWEGLLQNPQLTPPEVARIAKNGTLSRPLAASIVANGGWLQVGEVQRALLSNPRVGGPQIERILRAMNKSDLDRVAGLSAYRGEVRAAAKKLLGK